ncbi:MULTISPECIES: hypothetical protein [Halomonas]|uniref:hypothetical protein n=1 Tax=Halomonas TaxID=2745 RepID=UPI003CE9FFFC
METQWILKANWWKSGDREAAIKESHKEALEEHAFARMGEMMEQGYLSGELNDTVRMDDDDPDDGIEYRGHWEVKKSTSSE